VWCYRRDVTWTVVIVTQIVDFESLVRVLRIHDGRWIWRSGRMAIGKGHRRSTRYSFVVKLSSWQIPHGVPRISAIRAQCLISHHLTRRCGHDCKGFLLLRGMHKYLLFCSDVNIQRLCALSFFTFKTVEKIDLLFKWHSRAKKLHVGWQFEFCHIVVATAPTLSAGLRQPSEELFCWIPPPPPPSLFPSSQISPSAVCCYWFWEVKSFDLRVVKSLY
jgi:hypothetical protein